MASTFFAAETAEWYDTTQPGFFSGFLPDANINYAYAGMRLISWFPVVNSRGATYFSADITDEMISSLPFSLANLRHDKGDIIGTVVSAARTDQGIDIVVQIDREAAIAQGLSILDLRAGKCFSRVSVEMTRDPAMCRFLVVDGGYNIIREIPTLAGRKAGIRRTTASDPYLYQGNKVIEAVVPERFTGVGFTPNPSDVGAELYALAADDETEERLLLNPNEAPLAQSQETDMALTPKEIQDLQDKVIALETAIAAKNTESETASTSMADLNTQIAELKALLATKETELASATTEATTLRVEKEKADRETAIDALVAKWELIKATRDDAERVALRETASHACGDDGVIRSFEQAREIEQLRDELAALKAAPVVDQAAIAAAAAADAAAVAAAALAAAAPVVPPVVPETEIADEFTLAADPLVAAGAKLIPMYKGHKVSDLTNLS
jgi:hypothetical protein